MPAYTQHVWDDDWRRWSLVRARAGGRPSGRRHAMHDFPYLPERMRKRAFHPYSSTGVVWDEENGDYFCFGRARHDTDRQMHRRMDGVAR